MLSRIQDYLRRAARHQRVVEQVGPFLLTCTPSSDNPFINYAIPAANAAPAAADVAALVAAFRRYERRPRLEFIADLAPGALTALLAAGFEQELTTPLMICTPATLIAQPQPTAVQIIVPATDVELWGMSAAQHMAFGDEPPPPEAAAHARAGLRDGKLALAAQDVATGAIVGGGECSIPLDGLTEVAGIGVLEAYRRRGIAAALTYALTQAAFARGVELPFLMAGAAATARIYQRVGYQEIGTVVHIALPE